jgi:hypothetical protein
LTQTFFTTNLHGYQRSPRKTFNICEMQETNATCRVNEPTAKSIIPIGAKNNAGLKSVLAGEDFQFRNRCKAEKVGNTRRLDASSEYSKGVLRGMFLNLQKGELNKSTFATE